MNDFIAWYCSEPRLAFSKHVVLRYRIELESRRLSASTINLRLAAVRRLAFEAADSGLLSPELAAGIQRVKGAKKLGVRLGNWLTVDQCRSLLRAPDAQTLKGRRDRAILAILLGCGLRRAEVAKLQLRDIQQREEHWALVDLMGKGRHIRTVPVPRMGQGSSRRMDSSGRRRGWASLSVREPQGLDLGQRHHRKGHLAHCESQCKARWNSTARAPRLSSVLRALVPRGRRRVGADPIPAGSRFGGNDGTLLCAAECYVEFAC